MSIPNWCRVGAKVVCIRDFSESLTVCDLGYRTRPIIGCVYTVERTRDQAEYGTATVTLAEFEHNHWFDVRGFSPSVEDQTEADLYSKNGMHHRATRKQGEDA